MVASFSPWKGITQIKHSAIVNQFLQEAMLSMVSLALAHISTLSFQNIRVLIVLPGSVWAKVASF